MRKKEKYLEALYIKRNIEQVIFLMVFVKQLKINIKLDNSL
jgi:hypothetical protein